MSALKIGFAVLGATIFIGLAAPTITNHILEGVIYKDTRADDVFASRRDPWDETLQAAENAGLVGVGFGISTGTPDMSGGDLSFWLSRNLSSVGAGREKGNSQLAIWEETGLVGLVLYGALVLNIIWLTFSGPSRALDADARLQLALSGGLVVGLLVHSIFEAWWSSAGALESSNFWAVLGVHAGLLETQRRLRSRPQVMLADSRTPLQIRGGSRAQGTDALGSGPIKLLAAGVVG